MVRKVPNTIVRGGSYTFQQAIPADVRHRFGGKAVVQIPLRTNDPDQAIVAVGRLRATWKAQIEAARRGESADEANRELAAVDDPSRRVRPGETIEGALSRIKGDVTASAEWLALAYTMTREFLEFAGINLSAEQEERIEAVFGAQVARNILTTNAMRRIAVSEPAPAPIEAPRAKLVAPRDPERGPTLSEVFAMRGANLGRSKSYEAEKSIRQFEELHGAIPVREITPTHIRQFRDGLLSLPLKLPNAEAKLPLPDLLEKYRDHDGEKPTNATVKAKLSPISATLTFAVEEDIIQTNPAANIKVSAGRESEDRPPFDRGQLERIFKLPIFTAAERSDAAWFHIVSVYTGARPAELIQLTDDDIKPMPEGIDGHYIDITAVGDRSVKTSNSIRRVPIHPGLAASGFINWVTTRKGLLFPALQNGDGGKRQKADRAGKVCNKIIHDDAGIPSPWCLYSYRHTMQDAGRDSGLDRGTIDALVGREDQTSGGGYGNGYALPRLAGAMASIKLPADLSHLYR